MGFAKHGGCDPNQGILYGRGSGGAASKFHPMQLLFTSAGQVAGVRATVYGSSWTSGIGPSAQPSLVHAGWWIADDSSTWHTTVSFRDPSVMCSGTFIKEPVGDRLVVNAGTLDFNVPLTARDAEGAGYVPGSCMKTMGQHWMLDLTSPHKLTFVEGNMAPVVPMYWPADITGHIHAFFFATPVAQFGAALLGHGDWETPALTPSLMCQNFCASNCAWKTDLWSTMHIYLNSEWDGLECPGGSGIVGRSCPSDEPAFWRA